MKRILFVDDEPNVLEGLQRMLRPMRHEWEMAFASDGLAALALLESAPFDVVVSDMRMPRMDGPELLRVVQRRWPHVVRIALSGQSSQATLLRSVGPTHQFLAKPADAETLRGAVARSCALRDLLASESLQDLVAQMNTLPSLPGLYLRVVEELASRDASVANISAIIAQDVGMTAKVLQLVNSAFFGLTRPVSSARQAVSLLGLDTVKALVLSVHIFSQLGATRASGFSLESLQAHSLATATLAKRITAGQDPPEGAADQAFTAGLLHDAGQLVLAANLPDRYRQIVRLAREQSLPLCAAERQVLGSTHAEVGASLLGLWGLPDPIVEAVAFHHEPGRCPVATFSPLTAVHVADALSSAASNSQPHGASDQLDLPYLTRLGVAERLSAWQALSGAAAAQAGVP